MNTELLFLLSAGPISYILFRLTESHMKKSVEKSIANIKYKYSIGDKLIYRQINYAVDRLVGCEVVNKSFRTGYQPTYIVKIFTENPIVIEVSEDEIENTSETLGDFPIYCDKSKLIDEDKKEAL